MADAVISKPFASPRARRSADQRFLWRVSRKFLRVYSIASPPPGFPCAPSHSRHKRVESFGWKLYGPSLLGAPIAGHQKFHHLETVRERERRILAFEERADEMAILGFISVC